MAGRSHPRDKPRTTIRSIAEKAGVSASSVSTVLNNNHVARRIPAETVERIRAVARQLGYLPNIGARQLRSGSGPRTHVVIAWVTSFEAPLRSALPLSLRQAFSDHRPQTGHMNFSVLIEMFAAGRLRDMPGFLKAEHFNAAIITNTIPEDDRFLQENRLQFPAVLVNRQIPGYACVIESPESGAEAARSLIGAGRKRIGVLVGNPLTQITKSRVASFAQETRSHLTVPPFEIISQDISERGASDAIASFLDRGGQLDGLYVVTEGMALGAYHTLKQRQRRIPHDVAVVSAGDLDSASFFDPPLSTIGVPHKFISDQACQVLLSQLNQPGSDSAATVVLPVQRMMRASIGAYFPEFTSSA